MQLISRVLNNQITSVEFKHTYTEMGTTANTITKYTNTGIVREIRTKYAQTCNFGASATAGFMGSLREGGGRGAAPFPSCALPPP